MVKGIEAVLSVENIRVKALHGWYEEERKLGGMYNVSVRMYHVVDRTEQFETLDASINYELIYQTVLGVMDKEYHLIEHCCKAIFDGMKSLSSDAVWEVDLIKEEPPLKYVGKTSFTLKG